MKSVRTRLVAVLCVIACSVLVVASVYPSLRGMRTEDRNGDGRPDVWRHYGERGELVEVDIDSNFDGRPDITESYDGGVLVRRDSDRDLNGQVDLIEEFDATTHERVRSVVDLDNDGTADLVVLFHEGQPVFSKYEPSRRGDPKIANAVAAHITSAAGTRSVQGGLAPLSDPFRAAASVRGVRRVPPSQSSVGLTTSGGLPESCISIVGPGISARVGALDTQLHVLPFPTVGSPRAPPHS